MNAIRKTILAAAAVAAVMGSSAVMSNADAGWKFRIGHNHGIHLSTYNNTCWKTYWNGYKFVKVWVCGYGIY